ncbi:Putative ribosomal N-acetyltransferase YdaF [Microbacterium oleivorans]|uniref:GNAT family N-acetyltransferase n=1 Tax=Microbacterium oleivorans TaxID=273677 RepID=UPI000976068A|nr:GNAT family protein [Microbacterium oleivorans]AZS44631.1 Putative ribosomal N-acetyltransferase YdaF [Microbacterium oleivorans]
MTTPLIEPVTLSLGRVQLVPLDHAHADALTAARDGLEYAWYTSIPASVPDEISWRLGERDTGTMNPFAVIVDEKPEGMTTFCNIDAENRHVEIGYTWLSRQVQRTEVNTTAKRLLLEHAFEACDAIAVEFRTSWHNRQSRAAIERLGARQDGVLRNHRIGPGGSMRDTVVYSILPHEWPGVRMGLDARLAG